VIWVESCVELFSVDHAGERFVLAEDVESEATEEGEVGDGVAGACAAVVLAEGDDQDPVALNWSIPDAGSLR